MKNSDFDYWGEVLGIDPKESLGSENETLRFRKTLSTKSTPTRNIPELPKRISGEPYSNFTPFSWLNAAANSGGFPALRVGMCLWTWARSHKDEAEFKITIALLMDMGDM